MASPAIQRSPISASSSPLQRLSTFKDKAPTTTPTNATTPPSSITPITTPFSHSPSPLESFASDPIFSAFLSPDFNSTRFSSAALSSGSAASRIEKLQDGIRHLEQQLRSEVLSRHHDLLHQLSSIKDAESALYTLRSSISTLQSSVRHIRAEISDPHRQIHSKTLQLSNLHTSIYLLQSTIRVLRQIKKLRDVMAINEHEPEKLDLSKAAQLHFEILSLYNDSNLLGIDVVDVELKWVFEAGQKLRAEGMRVLERGLEGLNQAEAGAGLQVFYNLGELRLTIDGLISKYKGMAVKSLSGALDMKAISGISGGGFGPGGVQRSGTPQIGGGAKAKEALWQRMSACIDQLHSIVIGVWHLQRVLSKKRDPFTHILLLDEVMQDILEEPQVA
ncbi:unnamed protein product [Ilex paraguariensis]|uniref:Conserved oligomeric Golgi complex subunit 5 n=1 Tax=Ilex paraguariensis TaxID=185542 RepID=A0ABC8THC0_9AQUA